MLIHQEKIQLTTSSGSASINSDNIRGICHHIIVKPTTSNTQYNITITNSDSIIIYERTSEIGLLSELLTLPIRGIYTIAISSATNDELFNIQLIIQE